MLFMVTWEVSPENRDAAIARFKETGGLPPKGVKMIGRWHAIAQGQGVTICEAGDAEAVGKWAMQWTDLMRMEAVPVLDDEGAQKVLFG